MEKIINEVENAFSVLKSGGIILYPTDTIWGIGCDATNDDAINKINSLKNKDNLTPMLSLINSSDMLNEFLHNKPNNIDEILKEFKNPTTIVYSDPKNISKLLISNKNTVAFRIVKDNFCSKLISRIKKPIVSTSANIHDRKYPVNFKEIDERILKGVDYIVNLPNKSVSNLPSSIIKVNKEGEMIKLR